MGSKLYVFCQLAVS